MKYLTSIVVLLVTVLGLNHGLAQTSIVVPNTATTGQVVTFNIHTQIVSGQPWGTTLTYAGTTLLPIAWQHISGFHQTVTFHIPPNAPVGQWSFNLTASPWIIPNAVTIGSGIPNVPYGEVSGTVYRDLNANCVADPGDPKLANQIVTITPGPYYVATNSQGVYNLYLPLGTYTASRPANFPSLNTCPLNGQQNFSLATNGQVLPNVNFAVDNTLYTQASIGIHGNALRPGFTSQRSIYLYNSGNVAIPTATVRLVKPAIANWGTFNPAPATIVADTAEWNVTNLAGQQILHFALHCPPNVAIGTQYPISAVIIPNPMDFDPYDNTVSFNEIVVGAWDPNEKHVHLPGGQDADGDIATTDSVLDYTVHFQNTGTFAAQDVYVRDTLDVAHLDLSTFQLMGASHAQSMTIGPGGELEVMFAGINLPDSGANQAGSNGYFSYRVQTQPGLVPGTILQNRAAIYFDYNPPVITNTTETRICPPMDLAFAVQINGLDVQFQDLSTGTVDSYFWDFGDGNTSTSVSPLHHYALSDTYTVCLIAQNLCKVDTLCQEVVICVPTAQAGFLAVANQFTYSFQDQSVGAVQYAWDFGDGGTSTVASPTHTYAVNGVYVVCQTVTDNCGTVSTLCDTLVLNVVGLAEGSPVWHVVVRPHPMGAQAEVLVQGDVTAGDYKLELVDAMGRVVLRRSGQVNAPMVLDRNGLAPGVYLYRVSQAGIFKAFGRLLVSE